MLSTLTCLTYLVSNPSYVLIVWLAGGGVGFYVRDGINCKIIDTRVSFTDKIFESLTVKLSYSEGKNVVVSSVYRSPTPIAGMPIDVQLDNFNGCLETLLNELSCLNCDSYIFLDSNINTLSLPNNGPANNYANTVFNNGFIFTNFKASRIQNNSTTLIDHILTNSKANSFSSGSIVEDISDHWITFLQPNLKKCKSRKKVTQRRLINPTNTDRFKTCLQNVAWDDVLNENDVDTCYEKFWDIYDTMYNINFPLVNVKFNKNFHKISDFMTNGLLTSRRNKIRLLKVYANDRSDQNKITYTNYRNLYNKLVKASKKLHISNKLNENAKNPKKMWETLNEITGGKKGEAKVEKLVINGNTEVTDQKLMAEEFNKFFTSIGTKISESVSQTNIDPVSLMPDYNINENLSFGRMSHGDYVKIIDSMQPKMSSDISGISTKFLKLLKYELAVPLVHLFNLSLSSGTFPNKLKTSRTIPIFKSGDKGLCDNYRPISLLSTLSKVLEKYVANRLTNHLEQNNILYENQYGFLRNRSTVHNLLQLTNFIAKELNERKMVVGVFLDLRKAFDVVPHNLLINKLSKMGIRGAELRWFASYLKNRKQVVDICGCLSAELGIDISVIQGSILGPILFLCYINDLYYCTNLFSLLFADDTAGLKSGVNLQQLIAETNTELKKIAKWFRANKMAVNVSKTKYIIFKNKGVKINDDINDRIVYDDNEDDFPFDNSKLTPLLRVYNNNPDASNRTYKLLGLYLDEHLSFDYHCDTVCSKLAKSNFIMSRVKNYLPGSALRTIYFSMIHSHLTYCLPIYGCTTAKNIKKIEIAQKKAIRTVFREKYNAHTAELFRTAKIMPFKLLLKYQQSLLIHSIHHQYSPKALFNTWTTIAQRNQAYQLRNANNYFIPHVINEQLSKLPYFVFPRLWNELNEMKYTPNPVTFKLFMKELLLSEIV
jgi:Reverse transcriptase (RNA-dependent DNA polymerase)